MRVVVFGAGSLGSLVGGLLTRRHDVTLVGRQPHIQAIEESGLVIAGMVEAVVVPHAVESARGLQQADMVVITVKSYDTSTALDAVRPPKSILAINESETVLSAGYNFQEVIQGQAVINTYGRDGNI